MADERPMKPAQYAEHLLLTRILDGTWAPGTALPAERELAREVGVTRPTLRETLSRLAAQGWVTISHGRPTVVNDYWNTGGLGLLGTLTRYGGFLPPDFVLHLLELRVVMLPGVAARAAAMDAGALAAYLAGAGGLADEAGAYAAFDWGLQELFAHTTRNPIFRMILNDFTGLFTSLARFYFELPRAREASAGYYRELCAALDKGPDAVAIVVETTMKQSVEIWNTMPRANTGGA